MDCSDKLRQQIIELQATAWPLEPGDKDKPWPENPEVHLSSFVLLDNDTALSHVAVVGKSIVHQEETYNALGISEVVTHPSYQRLGYGLQLIKEAASFIKNSDPDISVFTCHPSLINFYVQGGWEYMENTCLVGGTYEHPFRSDSLGLATMMDFHSDKAKKNRNHFDNADIYLDLGEKQLW